MAYDALFLLLVSFPVLTSDDQKTENENDDDAWENQPMEKNDPEIGPFN